MNARGETQRSQRGLRVMLIAPHPFFSERGTPIAERNLIEVLSRSGVEMHVLTYPHGVDVSLPNCTIHRIRSIPGLGPASPGPSARKLVYDSLLTTRAVSLARTLRPDVVHAVEESVFMALLIERLLGIPYVYDMDSLLSEQSVEKYPWLRPARRLMEHFERKAIRRSRGVLAVCTALKESAQRRCPGKLVAVAEDVSLLGRPHHETAAAEGESLRDVVEDDGPIVLYVGNLEPYQGVGLLLEGFANAAADVPAAHLIIIGGTLPLVAQYRAKAKSLGLGKRIHFLGPRPPGRLGSFLAQADCLVSSRISGSNTPMKLYSYLDSGRPVVATRLLTHTQILDEDTAYLVDPDPRSMGRGIVRAVTDTEGAAARAQNARQLVKREFSPEAFKRKVLDFYGALELEWDHRARALER